MPIRSRVVRVVSVVCLIFSLTVFAFADTIRLKDGSLIKGKIVSFDGGVFTVLIGDNVRQRRLTFRADEIESIKFESAASPPAASPAADSKIIKVGQTRSQTDPAADTTTRPVSKSPSPPATAQPIAINVSVLADETANGWTNSGWVVSKGQRIRVSGKGRVSLGNGRFSSPRGISTLPDQNKLIKDKPTGGLIAVIGDDNNDFIYIGDSYEFTAERDGHLFLGINEGELSDNSGSFDVRVEIDPATTK